MTVQLPCFTVGTLVRVQGLFLPSRTKATSLCATSSSLASLNHSGIQTHISKTHEPTYIWLWCAISFTMPLKNTMIKNPNNSFGKITFTKIWGLGYVELVPTPRCIYNRTCLSVLCDEKTSSCDTAKWLEVAVDGNRLICSLFSDMMQLLVTKEENVVLNLVWIPSSLGHSRQFSANAFFETHGDSKFLQLTLCLSLLKKIKNQNIKMIKTYQMMVLKCP